MIDIHCHILHGLDDGADSLETSLAMAEQAIADGVTQVVATPHANSQYPYVPELIRERKAELEARLGGRLALSVGCDFHLSYENLEDAKKNPAKYSINGKGYLLVEFADYAIPPTMENTLHELHLASLQPIITHPERNPIIRAHPSRLDGWLRMGCYVQVTAGSFFGRFGQGAQHRVEKWLDEDRIHFVASDAHNTTSRPLQLKAAYERVAERRDEEIAQAIFNDNPLAATQGKPLPWEPEPLTLPHKRRKRFWFF